MECLAFHFELFLFIFDFFWKNVTYKFNVVIIVIQTDPKLTFLNIASLHLILHCCMYKQILVKLLPFCCPWSLLYHLKQWQYHMSKQKIHMHWLNRRSSHANNFGLQKRTHWCNFKLKQIPVFFYFLFCFYLLLYKGQAMEYYNASLTILH